MKQNWLLIAGIVAVLSVPFGLAVRDDAKSAKSTSANDDLDDELAGEDSIAYLAANSAELKMAELELAEGDEEEPIGAWKRADEPDLSFISDNLDEDIPWLAGEPLLVWPAVEDGQLGLLDEVVRSFSRRYGSEVSMTPRTTGAGITALVFGFPSSPRIEELLENRWGAADVNRPEAQTAAWIDDDEQVKAVLQSFGSRAELIVSRFIDVEEVLVEWVLDFDPRRLQTVDQARERFGSGAVSSESNGFSVHLAPTRYANTYGTVLWFVTDDKGVTSISLTADFTVEPNARLELLDFLAKTYGKPASDPMGGMTELTYPNNKRLRVFAYPDRLVFEKSVR